jgi:N-acetylmuramoyl-L-alanine amidase
LPLAVIPPARAADGPLAGAVIVVDPGHGGQAYSKSYTGGTKGVTSGLTESALNLRVGLELASTLKAMGATVHLTRVADHRLSREGSSAADELHARIDLFEHFNPHFFLSVHHNAGKPTASGHTALYKHNATADGLYEAAARSVNDALVGAVPGPKLALIKGSYHILRETPIPGTISEAGFMTNPAFDTLCNRPEFPKAEAAAIARGAAAYWAAHKPALVALRTELAAARAAQPRDPNTLTATALNPAYQTAMTELLAKVTPSGKYDGAKAGEYVAAFGKLAATDKPAFAVTTMTAGDRITLTGSVGDRRDHDRLIDMLVAMKLYAITNDLKVPKPGR